MSGIAPNGLKLFQIGEKEKVLRVVSSTLGEKKDTTSETKAINCNNDFRHCIREQEREIDQEGVSRAVRTFVMWRTNNPSLLLVSSSLLRVCVCYTSVMVNRPLLMRTEKRSNVNFAPTAGNWWKSTLFLSTHPSHNSFLLSYIDVLAILGHGTVYTQDDKSASTHTHT